MSTQRPVIVFDRKPFPKIVDPGIGPYTLARLTEVYQGEKKGRTPVRPKYPTPQEVQVHGVNHRVGTNQSDVFIWGRWLLTMADGQQRNAWLAGVLGDAAPRNSLFRYKKGWGIYECGPGGNVTLFEPEFYADMTPLKADGTPL